MEEILPLKPLYSVWFIDRATLWIDKQLYGDSQLIDSLRPYCVEPEFQNRTNGSAYRIGRFALNLRQPTPAAFAILSSYGGVGDVFELELAWDFIMRTHCDAERFENWVRSHLVELWRGNKTVCNYEGTRYSGNRHINQTAMYSNRPSKIEKKPCVHLEWRMRGARAIHAAKCDLDNLAMMDDSFHRAFWEKRIRFVEIDLTKLGRIVLGMTRSKGRLKQSWVTKVTLPETNKIFIYDHLYRIGCFFKRFYGLDQQELDDLQTLVDVVKKRFGVNYTQYTIVLPSPP